ncbi:hypothetical protein ZWY2020_040645 [Hordeum vulgare]|nr:hypothetical protein ZWY2020_040645 [Hordeum vulgare]
MGCVRSRARPPGIPVRDQGDHDIRSPIWATHYRTKICCSQGASVSEEIYQWWVQ